MSRRTGSDGLVAPPLKRAEYELFHITQQAAKGWRDILATQGNAVVDACDRLTQHPTDEDGTTVYQLRANLATGSHDDKTYNRYQYKLHNGARIWYFVDTLPSREAKSSKTAGRVLIENVHTAHPNETK